MANSSVATASRLLENLAPVTNGRPASEGKTAGADKGFSGVMSRTLQDTGSGGASKESLSMAGRNAAAGQSAGWKNRQVPMAGKNDQGNGIGDSAREKARQTQPDPVKKDSVTPAGEEARDVKKAVTDAADDVKEKIKEELGITKEQLKQAMEALGLTAADLLNQDSVQTLVLEVTGQDPMGLVMDAGLYQTVEALTAFSQQTAGNLAEALQVSDTELFELLQGTELSGDLEALPDLQTLLPEQVLEEGIPSQMQEIQTKNYGEADPAGAEQKVAVEVSDNRTEDAAVYGSETAEMEEPAGSQVQKQEPAGAKEKTETDPRAVDTAKSEDARSASEGNGGSMQQDRPGEGEPSQNTFPEQFMNGAAELKPQSAEAASVNGGIGSSGIDVQDIMRQITDYMKVQINEDTTQIEMKLTPENLGTISVRLAAKENALTAQFVAQNEAVKAVLQAQVTQLRENLSQQGVKVEAVEVTVASHEFESAMQQSPGQESGQSQPQEQRRTRRLQLFDDVSLEEMDLSQEERIAAELMEQSGNTVDYTA